MGFATAKPLVMVAVFAALGIAVTSFAHAATTTPTGPIVNSIGKCLDNKNASTSNNNTIQLYTCNSNASSQKWNLPGDGTIRNQNKCLDVYRQAKSSGSKVVLYSCNGSTTQKWAATSTKTIVNAASNLCLDNKDGSSRNGNTIQIYTCGTAAREIWTVPVIAPTPPPAPAPTPTPTPTPSPTPGTSPSGEDMPLGDLPGWHQTFADDFTKDAALGTWGTSDSQKVVYTGDHGGNWVEYPDGWSSTYTNGKAGYQPAQVLSVHDGVLDFHLHNVNGLPSGANPSPLVTGTSQYQTYGRYATRFKVDTGLSNYYAAWLLWPSNDSNGGCAESDFPEGSLNGTVEGFAHNSTKCSSYSTQDAFSSNTRFDSGWHTYVQEWSPGVRKYYLDGVLMGTSTTRVWSQDARWQLQTEPNGSGSADGHLTVDWVAAYAYQP
jgi:hypothetical protein